MTMTITWAAIDDVDVAGRLGRAELVHFDGQEGGRRRRWRVAAVAPFWRSQRPFFFLFSLSLSLFLSLHRQPSCTCWLVNYFPGRSALFFYILACFWLLLLVLLPWKWPSCTLRAFHHWLSGHRIEGYFRVCFFSFLSLWLIYGGSWFGLFSLTIRPRIGPIGELFFALCSPSFLLRFRRRIGSKSQGVTLHSSINEKWHLIPKKSENQQR